MTDHLTARAVQTQTSALDALAKRYGLMSVEFHSYDGRLFYPTTTGYAVQLTVQRKGDSGIEQRVLTVEMTDEMRSSAEMMDALSKAIEHALLKFTNQHPVAAA